MYKFIHKRKYKHTITQSHNHLLTVVEGSIEDLRRRLQMRIEAIQKKRSASAPAGSEGGHGGKNGDGDSNGNGKREAVANKRKKAKHAKEEKQQRQASKDVKGILVASPRTVDVSKENLCVCFFFSTHSLLHFVFHFITS